MCRCAGEAPLFGPCYQTSLVYLLYVTTALFFANTVLHDIDSGSQVLDIPKRAARFLEEGYAAASIDNIIKVAGGAKSKVYSYFGSKAELFEAVVSDRCQKTLRPLQEITFTREDVPTALESFGHAFLRAILAGGKKGDRANWR